MSGDGYHVMHLQPVALAPAPCPGREEYDPSLPGPENYLTILQDDPSLHGRMFSDKAILNLECELYLSMLPLVDWGSGRGSDFPKEVQGD